MRRVLAMLLAAALLLVLAGCGGNQDSSEEEPEESVMEESVAEANDPPYEPEEEPEADGVTDANSNAVQNETNYELQEPDAGGVAGAVDVQPGLPAAQSLTTEALRYPVGTESIAVTITNNSSDTEGGYGLMYRIERSSEGGWLTIPLDFAVIEIWAILAPGQSNTETIHLYPEQYNYEPGGYRIVMGDAPVEMIAEFVLE